MIAETRYYASPSDAVADVELVSEGKFGSPQEVAEFCHKEMERRCKK